MLHEHSRPGRRSPAAPESPELHRTIIGLLHRVHLAWSAGLTAALAILIAVAVEWPLFSTEVAFALVNAAVAGTFCAFGVVLYIRNDQAFTGSGFVLTGLLWAVTVPVDIYSGYWPFFSFVATGMYYVTFGWAILRYDQPRLVGPEKLFPVSATVATSLGSGFLALFSTPEALGYRGANIKWIILVRDSSVNSVAAALTVLLWVALGVFFVWLLVRRLRLASPLDASIFYPPAIAGAAFAVTSCLVVGASTAWPGHLPLSLHQSYLVTGLLALAVIPAFIAMSIRQQLFINTLFRGLPRSLIPDECERYFALALGDPGFRILLANDEGEGYLDVSGYPSHTSESASYTVSHADGRPILMVLCPTWGQCGTQLTAAFASVVEIIAENVRLSVLANRQLRQLKAARAAADVARQRGAELVKRDLHDGVQQTIRAAQLDLEGLAEDLRSSSSATHQVITIGRKLDAALNEVRCLSRGVSTLDKHAPPDMSEVISSIAADLRLRVVVSITQVDTGPLFEPIIYFVRESLTNTRKHSGTDAARVEVNAADRRIRVVVSDSGVGGAHLAEGGGLAGLHRRVEEADGTLSVRSYPGAGTTLEIDLPHP